MATPPESQREASLRSRVIWSFWAVILLLGLPTWWQTTSIYRASLPTTEMLDSPPRPHYPVEICVAALKHTFYDISDFSQGAEEILRKRATLLDYKVTPNVQCKEPSQALHVHFVRAESFRHSLSKSTGEIIIQYNPDNIKEVPQYFADTIEQLFADEQAAIAYILAKRGQNDEVLHTVMQSLSDTAKSATEKSATRAFKASPNYHLTFSLFSAAAFPSSWDIDKVLQRHIYPLIHGLALAANISVTSQVQLYAAFSPSTQPEQREDGWILKQEHLSSFINTAEWPLSPSVGDGPTINFILYVPSQRHMPLSVEGDNSNSWLIPQWGGIAILNPPLIPRAESELGLRDTPQHLDQKLLESAFRTFGTQLLQLLGVPQTSSLPLDARFRAFERLTGLSLYLRASSNLGSLARLATSLSNIPIPKHVLRLVEVALEKTSQIKNDLAEYGTNVWTGSVKAAQDAYSASEKAFFDKAMVGQVYFPDEHKVAVYLPLLGPIGVPLIVGLIRELKQFAARAKA